MFVYAVLFLCFPSSKNSTFSPGEICSLVQNVLLLAQAVIGAKSSEFGDGNLIFATLFCCFCKSNYFFQEDLNFVLKQIFSIAENNFVFSGIAYSRERNKIVLTQYLLGELTKTRLLGAKGTEENIPENRSLSPMTKIPSKNSYFSMQKIILRKMRDLWPGYSILYSRYHCFQDRRDPFIFHISSS